ncbi:MAG: FKBP-type peptidyl-prolyl cis-trans isomerase [Bacteroidetes bacterium]|nr:FKBP-type peptidyl-prolyl cis-trans isomerase [Bacteroidota bacterium]
MNKKSQITILLVAILAVIITSCGNSKFPGFKVTKNGLNYKFHNQIKDAKKPNLGDILVVELTVKKGDSVLFTNSGNPQRMFMYDTTAYKGDLNEGFSMMGIGDSVTFVMFADSLKKIMMLPPNIKSGDVLYYSIKLSEIVTKASFEKEKADMMAKQQKMIEEAKANESKVMEKYLADNKIKVKPTASGLYFIEVKKGNGAKAENGKKVKVNYTGKLTTGKIFDTSVEADAKKGDVYNPKRPYEPIEFTLGKGEVIPGWDEAISMMKVGGKAKIVVPSKLAYGERGAGGVIPPCSVLVFDVELLGVN